MRRAQQHYLAQLVQQVRRLDLVRVRVRVSPNPDPNPNQLRVPASIAPGEWVLGFRWDCESSAQVWQSCADITITN